MIEVNKIYCENNLETMNRMPDGFIDLVVTSPPYDNLRDYKGYSFPFEEIAKELFRVVKAGGVVVWVVGDATVNGSETLTSFKQALFFKEVGFNVHDTMIYYRVSPYPSNNRYQQSFEYMFVLSKDKPKTFNPVQQKKSENSFGSVESKTYRNKNGATDLPDENAVKRLKNAQRIMTKTSDNIWMIDAGFMISSKDTTAFYHPAIFPEELAGKHIITWSNEGEIVYDPFSGSGTTAKMAFLLNRKYICSEISKEYVELSEKRLKPYLQQTNLFKDNAA